MRPAPKTVSVSYRDSTATKTVACSNPGFTHEKTPQAPRALDVSIPESSAERAFREVKPAIAKRAENALMPARGADGTRIDRQ
jgi:hypothetical protein